MLVLSISALAQERPSVVIKEDYHNNPLIAWIPTDFVIEKGAYVATDGTVGGADVYGRETIKSGLYLTGGSTVLNEGHLYGEGYLSSGLVQNGKGNYVVNRGLIDALNPFGISVSIWGNNNTFINEKEGTVVGIRGGYGVSVTGHNNKIIHRGTAIGEVALPGDPLWEFGLVDSGALAIGAFSTPKQWEYHGPLRLSSNNTIDIYGNAYGWGKWGQAVTVWQGDNHVINIHPEAHILGYLSSHPGVTEGRKYIPLERSYINGNNITLNIDKGNKSYIYRYIGKWNNINDLAGRPVVEGNEFEEVIPFYGQYEDGRTVTAPVGDIIVPDTGSLEIVDEGQFARVIMVDNALLNHDYQRKNARRRLRNRHYDALKGRFQPWVQSSYSSSSRQADPSDKLLPGYEEKGYGVFAGLPVQILNKKLDFIAYVGKGNVDLKESLQTVDSTDIRFGIYLPRFFKFRLGRHKTEVSGRALVGYTRRETVRDVLTNVNTTPGIVKYEGTSNVIDVQVGASAETEIRLRSRTTASFRAGLDIAYDLISAYSEKENGTWFSPEYAEGVAFKWETRHLLQGIATVSAGVQHRTTRRMNVYGVSTLRVRQVLMGQEAKYTLGGVGTSFKGGNYVSLTGQFDLGLTYRLTRKIKIGASAQTRASSDGVTGYAAGAFLDWRFGR